MPIQGPVRYQVLGRLGVIADNLINIGRALSAPANQR